MFLGIVFFFLSKVMAAPCPSDMVRVNSFCIDRYEAPNLKGAKPFVARTALDGERWCQSKGKELCSDVQWQLACEGNERRKYPYGNRYRREACNDNKVWRVPNWRLVQRYNPRNPDSNPEARDHINYLNQSEVSGKYEECVSKQGAYDFTGNTAEWVRNTRRRRSSANGKIYKHNIKGCYWSKCYKGTLPNCQFTNPNHASAFRSYETGFRCCKKIKGAYEVTSH